MIRTAHRDDANEIERAAQTCDLALNPVEQPVRSEADTAAPAPMDR
jgi:hypothetical protein